MKILENDKDIRWGTHYKSRGLSETQNIYKVFFLLEESPITIHTSLLYSVIILISKGVLYIYIFLKCFLLIVSLRILQTWVLLLDGFEELFENELIQNGNFGVLINFEDVVVAEFALILAYKVANVQRELLYFFVSGAEPLLKLISFFIFKQTHKWILLITANDLLVENQNLFEALLIILSNYIVFLLIVNSLDYLLFDNL